MMPNNIQIELVEGCNRMCSFCGIHAIWKNKEDRIIKMMDLDMAKAVAKSLYDWGFNKKRIEFAMHGEPTLHPNLIEIINLFRTTLPLAQLQLTTNGSTFIKNPKLPELLFNNGLNILMVDMYSNKEAILKSINNLSGIPIQNYYAPECINPYYYNGNSFKVAVLIDDLAVANKKKKQRVILNHAGNGNPTLLKEHGVAPLLAPLVKKCSRPFREISIHYDGTIPICCMDWKHEAIMGKFPEDGSIQNIWESNIFNTVRQLLYDKNRSFRPCYRCDYNGGFRLGFIKNPNTTKLEDVHKHFTKYNKYNHKNTTDPILYKSQSKGIGAFLK